MEGGSRAVSCPLCPVKHGAFKRTTDGSAWVHLVCAYWQGETSVAQVRPLRGGVSQVSGCAWCAPACWQGETGVVQVRAWGAGGCLWVHLCAADALCVSTIDQGRRAWQRGGGGGEPMCPPC